MTAPTAETSDDSFRRWMRANLVHATAHFALTVTGKPHWGWRLRSIGVPARSAEHGRCWLRVGSEQTRFLTEWGEFWTGNVEANIITGVRKPVVLDSLEWDAPEHGRRVRAEVMTFLPGNPCSLTQALRSPVGLSEAWWRTLRRSLERIRAVPTARFAGRKPVSTMATETLGFELRIDRWETVHGDLHWNNLMCPEFGVVDWEMWGRGPAGSDAATLYCLSLLVPAAAKRVHAVFADILDSPAGHTAQLFTAARLLRHTARDCPELDRALRKHIRKLTAKTLVRETL